MAPNYAITMSALTKMKALSLQMNTASLVFKIHLQCNIINGATGRYIGTIKKYKGTGGNKKCFPQLCAFVSL